MEKKYIKSWNQSVQRRKQRKFRYNAPLHIRQKLVSAHLSKPLRLKYKTRSAQPKTGDKVKIMRGQFNGKTGKIERIDLKKLRIYVTGIEILKKDGTKLLFPLHPSNIMIEELNLDDKKRGKVLERNLKNG
jgi:large subunit ribosomal protein L24